MEVQATAKSKKGNAGAWPGHLELDAHRGCSCQARPPGWCPRATLPCRPTKRGRSTASGSSLGLTGLDSTTGNRTFTFTAELSASATGGRQGTMSWSCSQSWLHRGLSALLAQTAGAGRCSCTAQKVKGRFPRTTGNHSISCFFRISVFAPSSLTLEGHSQRK